MRLVILQIHDSRNLRKHGPRGDQDDRIPCVLDVSNRESRETASGRSRPDGDVRAARQGGLASTGTPLWQNGPETAASSIRRATCHHICRPQSFSYFLCRYASAGLPRSLGRGLNLTHHHLFLRVDGFRFRATASSKSLHQSLQRRNSGWLINRVWRRKMHPILVAPTSSVLRAPPYT
jgi:hypothetical protein